MKKCFQKFSIWFAQNDKFRTWLILDRFSAEVFVNDGCGQAEMDITKYDLFAEE